MTSEFQRPSDIGPEIVARIRQEFNPAVGAAKVVIEEEMRRLAQFNPPFLREYELPLNLDNTDSLGTERRRGALLILFEALPARTLLAVFGYGEDKRLNPIAIVVEEKLLELFSEAVAPTVGSLFDEDLDAVRNPTNDPSDSESREPVPEVVEELKGQHQQLQERLDVSVSVTSVNDYLQRNLIDRKLTDGAYEEAFNLIEQYLLQRISVWDTTNEYERAIVRGRKRLQQLYDVSRQV